MSAENNSPKAVFPSFTPISDGEISTPQRRRSDRVCAHCDLPIGGAQFSVGLKSGRNLHIECYLHIYQHATDSPTA